MNFYKHHIGDYASATEHLTWDEDHAYTRLMRIYYRDERPLPTDKAKVMRLARAQTAGQRAAVETVLSEFFTLESDGYRNKRCDAEIESALEIGSEAQARRENEKERQRRHREERSSLFEKLRAADIVLPFDTSTEILRSRVTAINGHASVTDMSRVTGVVRTENDTAIQTPIARLHKPDSNSESEVGAPNGVHANGKRAKPKTTIPTDFTITDELRQQALTRIPDVDPDELFVQFRAHHESHGKTMKSWPAAWTTWIGNATKFGYPKKQSTVRKWD